MSLAATLATSGSSSTDATSYTTASVTAEAGALYILAVSNVRVDTTTPATPTVTGASQTWTQDETNLYDDAGAVRARLTVFSVIPTAQGSGTLTIDFGGATQGGCIWALIKITGSLASRALALVQSEQAAGSGTTGTVNLASFGGTGNMAIGISSHVANQAVTPGSGFTELSDTAITEALSLFTEHKLDDASVDATWASSVGWGMVAYEIALLHTQSVSGAITPTGTIANAWTALLSLAGSISPTGAISNIFALVLGGSISPTGTLVVERIRRLLRALVEGTRTLTGLSSGSLDLTPMNEDTLELDPLEEEEA